MRQSSASTPAQGHERQVLLTDQGDDGIHPDVLAYADELVGAVTPYRLRWLQRQYDRGLLHREAREAEAPVLVMTMGRSGSAPVDRRVGERVASKRRNAA